MRGMCYQATMCRTNYLILAIKNPKWILQKNPRFSIEILGQTKPSQTLGLPPLDSEGQNLAFRKKMARGSPLIVLLNKIENEST